MLMKNIAITTKLKKEVVDVTEKIERKLERETGICLIFLLHTTAAITTADLDPGTDLDMLDAFEALMPRLQYRHPHNPEHVTDHIMASMLGASLVVPVENGKIKLGVWQRVVLVELDGPREREIIVQLITQE